MLGVGGFLYLLLMRRHNQGAESWRERHGIEQRDGHGNGHGQSELGIEGSRDTADERNGNEHRHEYQGGRDEGRRDAMHGFHGSLIG